MQIRALKLALEMCYKRALPLGRPIYPWLVRHAGWQLTRFTVHSHNGKASFEIKGRPYRGEIAQLGECVWAREPTPSSKLEPRRRAAVWLGKSDGVRRASGCGPSAYR